MAENWGTSGDHRKISRFTLCYFNRVAIRKSLYKWRFLGESSNKIWRLFFFQQAMFDYHRVYLPNGQYRMDKIEAPYENRQTPLSRTSPPASDTCPYEKLVYQLRGQLDNWTTDSAVVNPGKMFNLNLGLLLPLT